MLGIHQYNDSIKSFQKNFLKDINNELKKQGFPNYEAYFESGNYEIDVRIGLSKRRDYAYDDLFDLINYDNGYDDRMPNNVKKINQFSINMNVQKIADFFGVSKEDIDPRFEIKAKPIKTVDLNDNSITFVFNGQEVSREDMEVSRMINF